MVEKAYCVKSKDALIQAPRTAAEHLEEREDPAVRRVTEDLDRGEIDYCRLNNSLKIPKTK